MSKLLELDIIGIIIFVTYLCSFFLIYIVVLRINKKLSIAIFFASFLSFAIPAFFYGFNQALLFKSIPPDTEVYFTLINDFESYYNKYSFGVSGYSILNYIPFKMCLGRPAVFITFNILYYNFSILFIYLAFEEFLIFNKMDYKGKLILLICIIMSILYPVALIHSSSILREGFLLFLFSVNIYYLVLLYSSYFRIKLGHIFASLLFLIFLFVVRPIVGFSVLIIYVLSYAHIRRLITVKNLIKLLFILCISFFLLRSLVQSIYNTTFNFDWIINYRNSSVLNFGAEGYGLLIWNGVLDYIVNPVLLFLQFLLSPLPILVSVDITLNKIIPLIDSVFIITFIIIPILLNLKKKYIFWYFVFLLITFFSALLETNISGAYRHRMITVIFLIPLVSFIFSKLRISRTVR